MLGCREGNKMTLPNNVEYFGIVLSGNPPDTSFSELRTELEEDSKD